METFGEWLSGEIQRRGWNQNELARRAGLSHGTVSNIINGNKQLGLDSIIAIARALNLPPETVLRAAGLLPPRPPGDERIAEALHILSMLERDDLDEIIQIARLKLDRKALSRKPKPAHALLKDK